MQKVRKKLKNKSLSFLLFSSLDWLQTGQFTRLHFHSMRLKALNTLRKLLTYMLDKLVVHLSLCHKLTMPAASPPCRRRLLKCRSSCTALLCLRPSLAYFGARSYSSNLFGCFDSSDGSLPLFFWRSLRGELLRPSVRISVEVGADLLSGCLGRSAGAAPVGKPCNWKTIIVGILVKCLQEEVRKEKKKNKERK